MKLRLRKVGRGLAKTIKHRTGPYLFWVNLGLVVLFLSAASVYGVPIGNGSYSDVTQWSYPRRVSNSCGPTLFVPTNSQAEWNTVVNSGLACMGRTQILNITSGQNQCGSGYPCSSGSVWAPVGGSAVLPVSCVNGYWPGGSRLWAGGAFYEYCSESGGGTNWTITCPGIPANAEWIQYWGSPCV